MTSRLKVVAFGLVLMAVLALPAAAATPETRTITVVGSGEAEPEGLPGEWTLVVSVEHARAHGAAERGGRGRPNAVDSSRRWHHRLRDGRDVARRGDCTG